MALTFTEEPRKFLKQFHASFYLFIVIIIWRLYSSFPHCPGARVRLVFPSVDFRFSAGLRQRSRITPETNNRQFPKSIRVQGRAQGPVTNGQHKWAAIRRASPINRPNLDRHGDTANAHGPWRTERNRRIGRRKLGDGVTHDHLLVDQSTD